MNRKSILNDAIESGEGKYVLVDTGSTNGSIDFYSTVLTVSNDIDELKRIARHEIREQVSDGIGEIRLAIVEVSDGVLETRIEFTYCEWERDSED